MGRLKKPWLAGQLGPEAMELNRRIKAALDPTVSSTGSPHLIVTLATWTG